MNKKYQAERILNLSLLILSVFLIAYTATRAWILPFTHDESYTFLNSAQNSFMEIISNNTKMISPNNHILNTLFMKLFYALFGSQEFFLRLQSILAHLCFIYFSIKILKLFSSYYIQFIGFILVNFNPFLLDFFSLARGYALSIALMTLSTYFLIRYLKEDRSKWYVISLISAGFSILANFALINYAFALLFILAVYHSRDGFPNLIRKSKPVFIFIFVSVVVLYEPLRKVIHGLDFGGSAGIIDDTIASLITSSAYKHWFPAEEFNFILFVILLIFASYGAVLILKFFKRTIKEEIIGLVFFTSLALILLLNKIEHALLGSSYLVGRFATFLLPLFSFTTLALFNNLTQISKWLKISSFIIISCFAFLSLYNMARSSNLEYVQNWKYDADTKKMLEDLKNEHNSNPQNQIKLGITWIFEPGINFYRVTEKLTWLDSVTREGFSDDDNYRYVLPEDTSITKYSGSIKLKTFPLTGNQLYRSGDQLMNSQPGH